MIKHLDITSLHYVVFFLNIFILTYITNAVRIIGVTIQIKGGDDDDNNNKFTDFKYDRKNQPGFVFFICYEFASSF